MSGSRKLYKYRRPQSPKELRFYTRLANILTFFGFLLILLAFGPLIRDEVWYKLKQLKSQEFILSNLVNPKTQEVQQDSLFARFLTTRPIRIDPINKTFSIVIEKIGVSAPIVIDVPVTDADAYFAALKGGVAHASVSNYPSEEPGNVYLFAHSSVNFWELGEYAGVFNLLRKLDIGDRVHIFFENKDYVYEVVNKEVLKGWDTYPLTRPVIEPTLTLQTCDPPNTTLNRLIVTSKLLEVKDVK